MLNQVSPIPAALADRLSALLLELPDSQFFILDTLEGDAIYRLALSLERLKRTAIPPVPPPVKKAGRPKGSKNKVAIPKAAEVVPDTTPGLEP